jgi:hypothetical protein
MDSDIGILVAAVLCKEDQKPFILQQLRNGQGYDLLRAFGFDF